MKKLYSPYNETELTIIRSLLEGEGFHYFVLNDRLGTIKTGPKIKLINEKTIMIAENNFDQAAELISDYLDVVKLETNKSEFSIYDKLRMIAEYFLFGGWFVPGKIWQNEPD